MCMDDTSDIDLKNESRKPCQANEISDNENGKLIFLMCNKNILYFKAHSPNNGD